MTTTYLFIARSQAAQVSSRIDATVAIRVPPASAPTGLAPDSDCRSSRFLGATRSPFSSCRFFRGRTLCSLLSCLLLCTSRFLGGCCRLCSGCVQMLCSFLRRFGMAGFPGVKLLLPLGPKALLSSGHFRVCFGPTASLFVLSFSRNGLIARPAAILLFSQSVSSFPRRSSQRDRLFFRRS
jgi:hypothetical protein